MKPKSKSWLSPLGVWAPLALMLGIFTAPACADGPSRESMVKAAFVFNFTQFVDWPSDAFANSNAPFVIGVVGQPDRLEGAMERAMADKTAQGHRIVVRHFSDASAVGPCQCLYLPAATSAETSAALQRLHDTAVLAVGETDQFMDDGGGIELFVDDDGHMRFKLDPDVLKANRLRVSAKLMKLATIIHKGSD